MTFATELEQLLDMFTTHHTFPKNAAPQDVTTEYHSCDVCSGMGEEVWEINHEDNCMAGKCQEALING
jgi:hypothetical protein